MIVIDNDYGDYSAYWVNAGQDMADQVMIVSTEEPTRTKYVQMMGSEYMPEDLKQEIRNRGFKVG